MKPCWKILRFQKTSGCMENLFISIDWMPFLAQTLYNVDLLFALEIKPEVFICTT